MSGPCADGRRENDRYAGDHRGRGPGARRRHARDSREARGRRGHGSQVLGFRGLDRRCAHNQHRAHDCRRGRGSPDDRQIRLRDVPHAGRRGRECRVQLDRCEDARRDRNARARDHYDLGHPGHARRANRQNRRPWARVAPVRRQMLRRAKQSEGRPRERQSAMSNARRNPLSQGFLRRPTCVEASPFLGQTEDRSFWAHEHPWKIWA